MAGCSYEVIQYGIFTYGTLAALAAVCIENLTNAQKLSNNDFTELWNLAEQLEAVSIYREPETNCETMGDIAANWTCILKVDGF